jgi:hypothetical protein
MTKIISKCLIIIVLAINCNSEQPIAENICPAEELKCTDSLLQTTQYRYGQNEFISNFQGQTFRKGFTIVVDSHFKNLV